MSVVGDANSDKPIESSPPKKRFRNGWTEQLDDLIADWADKAACARWMHERTARIYSRRDFRFAIPLVIMSGIAASGNFALNSIVGDDQTISKYAQLGLGGLSLITGIVQTISNTYAFSKKSESHRISAVSWGKFNRLLCIEMRLHPDERTDAMVFLKFFRQELDRLIEQSPIIPESIIKDFLKLFGDRDDLVKPEITGFLEHTDVYKDTDSRLKRIAAEATIALHYKRGILKQLVEDEIDKKTREAARETALKATRDFLRSQTQLRKGKGGKNEKTTFVEKQKGEREEELSKIAEERAGAVAEIRDKFRNFVPNKNIVDNGVVVKDTIPEEVHIDMPEDDAISVPDSCRHSIDENEKESV